MAGCESASSADEPAPAHSRQEETFAIARSELVATLRREGIRDEAVLAALGRVPRHEFVDATYHSEAYENHPLPIGLDQTISQPYVVALMSELLEVSPGARVLEIGTGSGYQAAVLAEMGCEVYTVEILQPLADRASAVLERLGYDNVHQRVGDGYQGWPAAAPFDAIIVTAAPETVPEPLVEQLAPGGRLVIPVGPENSGQVLTVISKAADGSTTTRDVIPVRFVPFVREQAR